VVPAAGRTVGLSDREARSVVSGLVQIDSAIDFASQRRASENNGAHGGETPVCCVRMIANQLLGVSTLSDRMQTAHRILHSLL
jgi:hypothetical protein